MIIIFYYDSFITYIFYFVNVTPLLKHTLSNLVAKSRCLQFVLFFVRILRFFFLMHGLFV